MDQRAGGVHRFTGRSGTGLMLAVAASLTSMVAGYSGDGNDDGGEAAEIRTRAQALRREALQLADDDASASKAFGAAFRLDPGPERDEAIRSASVKAAASSAVLGKRATAAIDDLSWLATRGNRSLVADVVVAFGALRAAVAGARTNVSFDLGSLRSTGTGLEQVRRQHPDLWAAVENLNAAMDRIDEVTAAIDHRAAPTDTD
ncbi:cyclodeaminase/cyclohydrolase family protein [Pseudarthrobacter sp. C4D7]|uniref:cyclodeaminase/cyclohydrolase family protein n=1 Tax=Pseudarthrobacter sp. C4D7 TaxID=2735268 RepID=UPI00353043DB